MLNSHTFCLRVVDSQSGRPFNLSAYKDYETFVLTKDIYNLDYPQKEFSDKNGCALTDPRRSESLNYSHDITGALYR